MKTNNSTKKENLTNILDNFFVIGKEMKPKNGEDSYAFSINENCGLMCVFDGCGGIGSRKYAAYGNKTGAYIASHTVAKTVVSWFNEFNDEGGEISGNSIQNICADLQNRITHELKTLENGVESSTIKGSLATRSFPTTASMILFKSEKERLYSAFVWAGDSRGYILTPKGLTQITKDDIDESEDAFSNLYSDGRLTNLISTDGNFQLNSRIMSCPQETILITATDGCFGYIPTPMEFEYMLIDTLLNSNSLFEWKQNLHAEYVKVAGDDFTMGAVVCGFSTFRNLRRAFVERKEYLYKTFIARMEDATEEEKLQMWEKYKTTYYRSGK